MSNRSMSIRSPLSPFQRRLSWRSSRSGAGSEARIGLQRHDHGRLQEAGADFRQRVELCCEFVSRSRFHNHASASCVAAKPDLLNQTGRVEATYFLELCLPQVCGTRGFGLIGMTGEQDHELHFELLFSCETPQLHGEAAGGLNAGVGEHTDGDDMRDAVLLECGTKSGCHSPPQLPFAKVCHFCTPRC